MYPPQLVLVLTPLTPLPIDVVAVLVTSGLLVLVALTLWILGVRDLRCYAAAFLWMPTTSGVLLGNVSIPLAFALAVAWRYRRTVWRPALAVGLAVSAKLLLWPVFVWLVATRRLRSAGLAVLIGLLVTLAAWAAIGFDGLRMYPDLLRRLSEIQSERSYSIVGMVATLGLGSTVGNILTVVVGLSLLVACVVFARRSDDARSFVCAVAATLVVSPIVWLHYLVVLLVPMAMLRPRFTALWLLPILLWASPRPGYAEGFQTFLPALVTVFLVAVFSPDPIGNASRRRRSRHDVPGERNACRTLHLGLSSADDALDESSDHLARVSGRVRGSAVRRGHRPSLRHDRDELGRLGLPYVLRCGEPAPPRGHTVRRVRRGAFRCGQ